MMGHMIKLYFLGHPRKRRLTADGKAFSGHAYQYHHVSQLKVKPYIVTFSVTLTHFQP